VRRHTRGRVALWAAVGLLVAGAACRQPAMHAGDARSFARKALTHIGLRTVRVSPEVTLARYRSPARRSQPVQVWRTHSTVAGGGTVDLYVTRRGDSAVFVRDVAPGGKPLLSDRQFRRLQEFRLNPAADRARDRVLVPAVVSVVLLVAAGSGLFFTVFLRGRREDRRAPEPEPEPA
jgi:hypothetical protein